MVKKQNLESLTLILRRLNKIELTSKFRFSSEIRDIKMELARNNAELYRLALGIAQSTEEQEL
jgi:hypothetical protein